MTQEFKFHVLTGIILCLGFLIMRVTWSGVKPSPAKPLAPHDRIIRVVGGMLLLLMLFLVWVVWGHELTRTGSQPANEYSALHRLQSTNEFEQQYAVAHPSEGFACDLARLQYGKSRADDEDLTSAVHSGYIFAVSSCRRDASGRIAHYELIAVPLKPKVSGNRSFCTDDTGVIWTNSEGSAGDCLNRRVPIR